MHGFPTDMLRFSRKVKTMFGSFTPGVKSFIIVCIMFKIRSRAFFKITLLARLYVRFSILLTCDMWKTPA